MKPSLLTLLIGIIALSFAAMAQAQTTTTTTSPTAPCPNGAGGPFNIYILGNFNPSLPYSSDSTKTYVPPASTTVLTLTLPPNITPTTPGLVADMTQAFANAPPFFLQQVCGLDGVFIYIKDCTSFSNDVCSGQLSPDKYWVYRLGPWQYARGAQPPLGHYGRYIAISAGPWYTQGTSGSGVPGVNAPKYSDYELMLLQQLMPWADAVPPTFVANSANPGQDNSAMAVLAALAHEFGHVLWYDTFRPTPGGSYDFNSFCRGTFFRNSWRSVDPPPTWRAFGDTQNDHELDDINISDIALAVTRHNISPGSAGDLLNHIYRRGGHWASLFAAFSPDEDFVETYKLYVLQQSNPPLVSLKITITGANGGTCSKKPSRTCVDDIPSDLTGNFKPELMRKSNCIAQLVNP